MDINYEIGHRYALKGQYKEAYFYLRKSSKDGNSDSMNDIGVMLERNQRYSEAVRWYRKAIKAGNNAAQYNLGNLYENGLGVRQDYKKAKEHYLKSISDNNSLGYKKLAKFYVYGLGDKKDYKKALEYLEEGAKIEKVTNYLNTVCTNALAFHYKNGIGVEKDEKKALDLWTICSDYGDSDAMFHLACYFLERESSKEDIELAIKSLIKLAIHENSVAAMFELTKLFEKGKHVKKDYIEASRWLLTGARNGDPDAFLKIANICLSGKARYYKLEEDYLEHAIVDFLSSTYGKEKEYQKEYEVYNKIKAKYPEKVDWEYLETMPDLSKKDESIKVQTQVC